jgi:hypothetical protein
VLSVLGIDIVLVVEVLRSCIRGEGLTFFLIVEGSAFWVTGLGFEGWGRGIGG